MQIIPKVLDRKGWSRTIEGEEITYINDESWEIIIAHLWESAGIDPITHEDIETTVLQEYKVI